MLAAAVLVQGPTIEMSISTEGREVGKAWLSQRLDATGKKTYAKLIMGDTKIVETAEYGLDGTPKIKISMRTQGASSVRSEALFSNGKVTLKSGDSTTTVLYPEAGSLKALSELWFLQTKPKANHVVEYQRFDLYTQTFVPCKVIYVGKENIEIRGKSISANRVKVDSKTDAWLDDRGDPYRMIIDGKTRFERVAP